MPLTADGTYKRLQVDIPSVFIAYFQSIKLSTTSIQTADIKALRFASTARARPWSAVSIGRGAMESGDGIHRLLVPLLMVTELFLVEMELIPRGGDVVAFVAKVI